MWEDSGQSRNLALLGRKGGFLFPERRLFYFGTVAFFARIMHFILAFIFRKVFSQVLALRFFKMKPNLGFFVWRRRHWKCSIRKR